MKPPTPQSSLPTPPKDKRELGNKPETVGQTNEETDGVRPKKKSLDWRFGRCVRALREIIAGEPKGRWSWNVAWEALLDVAVIRGPALQSSLATKPQAGAIQEKQLPPKDTTSPAEGEIKALLAAGHSVPIAPIPVSGVPNIDTQAHTIVTAILGDLGGRKGVGDELEKIETDIYEEIRADLVSIVKRHLSASSTKPQPQTRKIR